MRSKVLLVIGVALVLTILAVLFASRSESREGFTLTRLDSETIRISWGTHSGVNISPRQTLEFFLGSEIKQGSEFKFPQLSILEDVWMYSVQPKSLGSATPASYVNPLNDDAFDQMFELIRLSRIGNSSSESVTRIAAQHYTYLGWVVMDDNDVRALKRALADRPSTALNENIWTSSSLLYRLSHGVERHLASDPEDEVELQNIRRTVPVMYELLNPEAGHPCDAMHVLYLDGHVERIPMGDRFPATKVFIESFPPPPLTP